MIYNVMQQTSTRPMYMC